MWNQFDKLAARWETSEESDVQSEKQHDADDEIWYYDFPKAQLDLMLTDLAGSGFFENQQRPGGTANLAIVMDRGRTAKNWTPEPRLDDVILMVYREGWLHGFARNESRAPQKQVMPASYEAAK